MNGPKDYRAALADLDMAAADRGRPDGTILVNRALARDYLGLYGKACEDFNVAEKLLGGKVEPWRIRWVHSLVETGDYRAANRIWKGVNERFSEVNEVKAFGEGEKIAAFLAVCA